MPSYPSKCYELGNVPQLSYYFVVSLWDPPFGSPEEFGGTSSNIHKNADLIKSMENSKSKSS
jgi:hypothetical protein